MCRCEGVGTVLVDCNCGGRLPGCMMCEGDGQYEAPCFGCAPLDVKLAASSNGANDDGGCGDGEDCDCF